MPLLTIITIIDNRKFSPAVCLYDVRIGLREHLLCWEDIQRHLMINTLHVCLLRAHVELYMRYAGCIADQRNNV